ncbi:MAG: sulfatase-like hydrolase/transferase [Aureispira sp.]|nr:sulfatase-like hydrolase/transferase [Aureispira sp.]
MKLISRLSLTLVLFLILNDLVYGQSPNVVFILIDDQGWNGTSAQMDSARTDSKSDYYQTPRLAQLAQTGMTFSQAYAPGPKCSPSRNSIQTGLTTANSKFTSTSSIVDSTKILLEPSSNIHIDNNNLTFPELVKQSNPNYYTAHYGKWHLGSQGPAAHGFDRGDGNTSNNTGTQGEGVQVDPKLMYAITDSALAFIQDAKTANRPFFVQLSHYAVHSPSELQQATYNTIATRPIGAVHNDTLFGGMTEDVDHVVGNFLDSLTAWGLDTNTYVVYMSDNGASAGISKNTPLSRGKLFLDEGGIRVPLIFRGPNIPVNSYSDVPVVGYDLYPTFVELMLGNTSAVPSTVEGVSLKNVALGTSTAVSRNTSLIFHSPHYDLNSNKRPESAIRKGDYKFMVDYELGEFYLFNLKTDLEESNDLKGSLPQLTDSLCLELRDYLKISSAQMPTLNPAHLNNPGTAPDADNDGLNDEWEFRELLTAKYNGTDDPDGDGLDNENEETNGTDPYVFNTNTNLNKIEKEAQFKVYPNPSSSILNIEGETDFDKVLLYDYTGQVLIKKTRKSSLNVSRLPSGLYFLVLTKNGQAIFSEEVRINP